MTAASVGGGKIQFTEYKSLQGDSNRVLERGRDIIRNVIQLAKDCEVISPATSEGKGHRIGLSGIDSKVIGDILALHEGRQDDPQGALIGNRLKKLVSDAKEQSDAHKRQKAELEGASQKKIEFVGQHKTHVATLKKRLKTKIQLLDRMQNLLQQLDKQAPPREREEKPEVKSATEVPELTFGQMKAELLEIESAMDKIELEEDQTTQPPAEPTTSAAPQVVEQQVTEEMPEAPAPLLIHPEPEPVAMEEVAEEKKRKRPEESEEAPRAKAKAVEGAEGRPVSGFRRAARRVVQTGGAAAAAISFAAQDAARVATVAGESGGFGAAEGVAAAAGAMTRLHPATQVAMAVTAGALELPSMDTLGRVSYVTGGLAMFALTREPISSIMAATLAGRAVPPMVRGAISLGKKIFITPEFLRTASKRIAQISSPKPPTIPKKQGSV